MVAIARERMTTVRKRPVRRQLMQAQRVFEQGHRMIERPALVSHAHRTGEDSILFIMPATVQPDDVAGEGLPVSSDLFDQYGQIIDVLVSTRRDADAARRFFRRALSTLRPPGIRSAKPR